jgi:RNA polymerase sigma factor for flagellar operon FliA
MLWRKFLETKDETSQSELVATYLPLVRLQAGRLALGLPPQVSREDLLHSGVLGLLEALQRYDPSQGAKFETYAALRIRGAMLDELRRNCWLPRSLVRQMREMDRALSVLTSKLGREPTEEELAAEMGLKPETLHKVAGDINCASFLSLEELLFLPEDEDAESAPLASVLAMEEKAWLAGAIDQLPERQRLVLALYYQEEMTLKEIGLVLGVSESRVCQLHAQALARLRAIFKEG